MIELADIIAPIAPPPAPPPYGWIAVGIALVILVLFFVLRLWLKRTRVRRWARAALKRTERDLQHGTLDARTAAFHIARALSHAHPPSLPFKGRARVGMGANAMSYSPIPHLVSPFKGEEQNSRASMEVEWSKFNQALDRARFSPRPIDTQQAAQLVAQARQWIGRAS